MGMDVWGRNPSSDVGKYFRANIWSWRPIHDLIRTLCSDLLAPETIVGMSINDGFGPSDATTCQEMARRFSEWLATNANGHALDSDLKASKDGRLVTREEASANPSIELVSPYQVCDAHLREWVAFLQDCGGFAVR